MLHSGFDPVSQSLLDALSPSVAVLDLDGLILNVNQAWRQFGPDNGLGLTDAAVGMNYLQGFETQPHLEAVKLGIRAVLSGEAPDYVQLYPCHGPGQERWFELRARRFADQPYALIVHEDVTQRQQDARMIREQAEFVGSLLAHSPDCIKLLSLDGNVLWMNEDGERLLEPSSFETVRGQPWTALWPPETHAAVAQAVSAAASGQRGHFQGYALTAGGTRKFWDVLVTPVRSAAGAPVRLLATSRDMTELRAAQDEALRSNTEAAQMLSSMQEAFFTVDSQWRFTFLNPQAQALVQRTAAELLGQTLWTMFPDTVGNLFEHHYRRAMSTQRPERFEAFYEALGCWFDVRAYPHRDGLAVCFQDVTAQKIDRQAQLDRNTILEMVAQGQALPAILDEIALMVGRQLAGQVCLIVTHQGTFRYAAPGVPPALREALARLGAPAEAEAGTHPLLRRSPGMPGAGTLPEPFASGPAHELLLSGGLHHVASVPVIDGLNVTLGQLALYSAAGLARSDDVLAVLDRARHLAAVAIEHYLLTEQLTYQARYDALTGLANREQFEERLGAALAAGGRHGPTALLLIDVDNFKSVNDTLGHQVGDEVLREIARRLQGCFEAATTVARISGDEFTVILTHTPEDQAVRRAQQVNSAFDAPFLVADREIYLSASIGISVAPGGEDAQALQRHADLAMYHAKSHKSGHSVFHSDLHRRAQERFELASFLRRAHDHQELELYYQPIVALRGGALVGVEALLRWHHPQQGLVSPGQFIPIAEETGLIVPVGQWVLREACAQAARWAEAGHSDLRLAVNVASLQFEQDDFVDTVRRCLNETGLPAHRLTLELTERTVMFNVDESARQMQRLRDLGVSVAMDDFGTGHSSLSHLTRLPINILKIDRSFVSGLGPGSATLPLVNAIVNVADSLGLITIAEGIETPQELETLQGLGCPLGQSFLFARPSPPGQISALLAAPQTGGQPHQSTGRTAGTAEQSE